METRTNTTEPTKVKQTFKPIQLIIVLSIEVWVSPKKLCSGNLSIDLMYCRWDACYYGVLKYYNTMTFPCENQLLKCLE